MGNKNTPHAMDTVSKATNHVLHPASIKVQQTLKVTLLTRFKNTLAKNLAY